MRLWKSWIVTQKDLSVIRKNKYVFYSLIAMPIILGVILPAIFVFALNAEVIRTSTCTICSCRQSTC